MEALGVNGAGHGGLALDIDDAGAARADGGGYPGRKSIAERSGGEYRGRGDNYTYDESLWKTHCRISARHDIVVYGIDDGS